MKTIVEIETKLSKYLFVDDKKIVVTDELINCGEFMITDLNKSNSIIYENITAPNNWYGCKYTFDGTNWELNPLFTEQPAE